MDKQLIADYIYENVGVTDYDTDDYENTAWIFAKERWINLLKQPGVLLKYLIKKFMIVWSGTHYSIEYTGLFQSGIKHLLLLAVMALNNLIYFFMTMATFDCFRKKGRLLLEESELFCFCCTMILGTVCVLLLMEVMNKYNLTALVPLYIVWGMSAGNKFLPISYYGYGE